MENYVELVVEEKQYVETMFKLSFRVHCEDDELVMIWYIANFNNWINQKSLTLINCTMGIHRDTGKTHFHYHTVLMGKVFKPSYQANPITLFMRDYKIGTLKTIHGVGTSPYDNVHTQKYGTKSNISIKHRFMLDDEDEITFLQYPLKEGNTIQSINKLNNLNVDLDQLTKNAIAEYRVAKRKTEKFKQKKVQLECSWAELVQYLDQRGCETSYWGNIFECVLQYYKEKNKRPPTFRKMEVDTDAYAFYRETPEYSCQDIVKRLLEKKNL